MGKPAGKKKDHEVPAPATRANGHHPSKSWEEKRGVAAAVVSSSSSKALDEDTAMFINMSQELREEGNRLFQRKDNEGAMLKYEKALKLLPRNHIDVAHLHTSMAICYMQLGLGEYPRAISECNMALQVSPRYTKALLKRAKCYEALNRLDLAMRDVRVVLNLEPNNSTALEVLDSLRETMEEKGIVIDETEIALAALQQHPEPPSARLRKVVREKIKKNRKENKGEDEGKAKKIIVEEKVKADNVRKKDKEKSGKLEKGKLGKEDKGKLAKEEKGKLGKEEKENLGKEEREKFGKEEKGGVTRTVKLIYGEDIRWAQLPVNCGIRLVRDVIRDKFPGVKGVLVKYKDREGDLVTITNTSELRLAETCHVLGSIRLYVTKVEPEEEPFYDDGVVADSGKVKVVENGNGVVGKGRSSTVEDWLVQFARLFKNHVGFDSDAYLDIHGIGMKLYSEAMEDTVTSEAAQELFEIAGDRFQEMAALALFNWGSVHMSRARRRVTFPEDGSRDSSFECIQVAYEWAQKEYINAEKRFGEAVRIKPDFYEGLLALGHQQFEQARLCWCYLTATEKDLEVSHSDEVLQLFNKAEDNMEKGMMMWEEMEERRLNGLSKTDKYKEQLEKMGLHGLFRDVSADEADEQAARMRLQIYLLWGTLLYERSVVEFKLGLPTWEECVEVAVEKFELAGASTTDIGVMIKNHCSNETAMEGFKIDEIVQAWNEMYDGWQFDVPSFRLEPLFRRRVPKLHYILEQF
ncbi:protein PHOX1-like [Vigna unguiculata]|uniref:Stress-induced-phosphoprotein 1 n=1 Tax=Vigna unguiculata TaxID=3917 RepID=A0A4D6MD38_VIGUN|nr:protein PHOX1-like [Vigna unguiculata]QCD99352.1 stress-induced-phosphoprotein 1 [Vigna unguiculata]